MADHCHLDELIAATGSKLATELLQAFRAMARDPSVATTDYASKLKIILEQSIEEGQQHAPARIIDS